MHKGTILVAMFTIFHAGLSFSEDDPAAKNVGDLNSDDATPFAYDNTLMRQSELLLYHSFRKDIAISGRITKKIELKNKSVLMEISDLENNQNTINIIAPIEESMLPFDLGDKIRVLGPVAELNKILAFEAELKDHFGIIALCIVDLLSKEVLFHKEATNTCLNWELGNLEAMPNLSGRIKSK